MRHFLDQEFLDNTFRDYLWVAGTILFVFILKRFISKYLAIGFFKIVKREWKYFNEERFTRLIIKPLAILLVVTVSFIALYKLNFPSDLNVKIYKFSLQRILISISIIIQIITLTWLLLRILDYIASGLGNRALQTKDYNDNQLIVFFRDFLKVIIGICCGLLILHFAFRYNVSNLLTGLSIVGAAIALSLRESLENLIASFVIFFDKPFTTGDTVKVLSITGIVEKIGLRSTRIRSDQKTYVTVPNKQMVDTILDNQSLRTQQRNELNLQLSLTTPSDKLETLMNELRNYLANVKEIENYNVLFTDINIQAYNVMTEFFVPAAYLSLFNSIKQQLNLFALKTVERLEIKMAGLDRK